MMMTIIIIRFVTCGTIEEKMYRRQVYKHALMRASCCIDSNNNTDNDDETKVDSKIDPAVHRINNNNKNNNKDREKQRATDQYRYFNSDELAIKLKQRNGNKNNNNNKEVIDLSVQERSDKIPSSARSRYDYSETQVMLLKAHQGVSRSESNECIDLKTELAFLLGSQYNKNNDNNLVFGTSDHDLLYSKEAQKETGDGVNYDNYNNNSYNCKNNRHKKGRRSGFAKYSNGRHDFKSVSALRRKNYNNSNNCGHGLWQGRPETEFGPLIFPLHRGFGHHSSSTTTSSSFSSAHSLLDAATEALTPTKQSSLKEHNNDNSKKDSVSVQKKKLLSSLKTTQSDLHSTTSLLERLQSNDLRKLPDNGLRVHNQIKHLKNTEKDILESLANLNLNL